MAFGASKELLAAKDEIILNLKETIEDLKSDRERLQKRLDVLQEALIATRSPEAFAELKNDQRMEGYESLPVDPEKVQRRKAEEEWMRSLEEPLFSSAENMIEMLSRRLPAPEPESVHDNSES